MRNLALLLFVSSPMLLSSTSLASVSINIESGRLVTVLTHSVSKRKNLAYLVTPLALKCGRGLNQRLLNPLNKMNKSQLIDYSPV